MSGKCDKELERFAHDCIDTIPTFLNEVVIDPNDLSWPLRFYREYVSKSVPVLIKSGCKDFEATKLWNSDYFMDKIPDKNVEVAITPNGYADSITILKNPKTNQFEKLFMLPETRIMKMKDFLQHIKEPKPSFVCYIQRQNSNYTEDFQELVKDAELEIDWASKAFDKKPDAVNFWMGDSRAITSLHKDFYENIYCVIDGYKDFLLIPPTSLPYIPYKDFKIAEYKNIRSDKNQNGHDIFMDTDDDGNDKTVPWIDIDAIAPNLLEYPEFENAYKYPVRVNKGDCLYLPSLWFHHVRQSHGCIAVNYWYDMDFDIKYCYFNLLANISNSGLHPYQ